MKIKRSKYLFFYHRNFLKLDLPAVLSGQKPPFEKQVVAIPILYGKEVILKQDEFETILNIPENKWIEHDVQINLNKFFEFGILLNESDIYKTFREREETLVRNNWHIYAALFNFMTKWKDVDVKLIAEKVKVDSNEEIKNYVDQFGKPPLHYHEISNTLKKIPIKRSNEDNDSFYNILLKRKTTRNFNKKSLMTFKDLSLLLKYSFATQGKRGLHGSDITAIKRTSPSGGDLHPTELYLLVLRVENLTPGIYHFNTESNEIHLIKEYSIERAEKKAIEFSAGQHYTSECAVLFLMATRYYRNYWKYRKNSAAYSVTIRDAAHICQNIYLLCTKINIGCFTAAINHINIEEEIGLNSYEQGISMMMGCGVTDNNPDISLEPSFS